MATTRSRTNNCSIARKENGLDITYLRNGQSPPLPPADLFFFITGQFRPYKRSIKNRLALFNQKKEEEQFSSFFLLLPISSRTKSTAVLISQFFLRSFYFDISSCASDRYWLSRSRRLISRRRGGEMKSTKKFKKKS